MMATDDGDYVRIALRIPRWLHDDIEQCAKASCWDLSKQVRFELTSLRGRAVMPHLPQGPNQAPPSRRRRRHAA